MNIFTVNGGDTMRVMAKDATHLDSGPITSNLTAFLTIVDIVTQEIVTGPIPVTQHSGDDWWVDVLTPQEDGQYRVDFDMTYAGAHRVLQAKLIVI